MANSGQEIGDYIRQRFEISQAVARLTQEKLALQQAGYGAEIELLGLQRDLARQAQTLELRAAFVVARNRQTSAEDAVVRCEAELAELEAKLQEIDRSISNLAKA